MTEKRYESDGVEIDIEKLKRMIVRTYKLERKNSKTGAKTDKAMKEEIEKIIEEEVKRCY